jgi:hypothetical protein
MQDQERLLNKLVGEVHALFMAVQVLAKTHPQPSAAAIELEAAERLGLDGLGPCNGGDTVPCAFKETMDGIRRVVEATAAKRGSTWQPHQSARSRHIAQGMSPNPPFQAAARTNANGSGDTSSGAPLG